MPTRKIYTNTIAQIGGKVLTAIISIGMIKILTGYLDIEGYGLYSKIYNFLSIFAVIADLGLYTITVRELSAHKDDPKMVDTIASNVLTLRTLSGGLIFIFSLTIGYFLDGYNSKEALIGIGIASFFTLLGLINSSLMSYLQSILKTEFSIIANTVGKLMTLGMIIVFAGLMWGQSHTEKFTLVMIAGLAGNLVMTALTWWYANRWHPVRFGWDTRYIRHILITSLPYGLALFLNVIFFKVDTILLSIMEPRELADSVIALYALPMKIVEVGMMYGTVFLNSLLPVLTEAFQREKGEKKQDSGSSQEGRDNGGMGVSTLEPSNPPTFQPSNPPTLQHSSSLITHAYTLLLFFGIGISAFLFLTRGEVTRIISTELFVTTIIHGFTSIDAMAIVVWIFLFYFISSLSTFILIAHGRQKTMMYVNAGIALINIVGNILVIPTYSFVGSAVVTLISQILLLICTWWLVRADMPLKQLLPRTGLIVVIGCMAGLSAFVLSDVFTYDIHSFMTSILRLSLIGGTFSIIYLSGAYIFRKRLR